jgi:3-deoxy-D-manno-octulosonic-acid transferase
MNIDWQYKRSLWVYNLLLPFLLLVLLPKALLRHRRRGGKWSDLWFRLGFGNEIKKNEIESFCRASAIDWIHAVSVGEVGIAIKLLKQHQQNELPQRKWILSLTTVTGYKLAVDSLNKWADQIMVIYSPLDLSWAVHRYMKMIRPQRMILVEAELWPNWLNVCFEKQVPVIMINARLSQRSERRLKKGLNWIKPFYERLSLVLTQSENDRQRFESIGVRPESLMTTGSIKYDPSGSDVAECQHKELQQVLIDLKWDLSSSLILLAASTHPGEEEWLAKIYLKLKEQYPRLKWILVPRHVERCEEIIEKLVPLNLSLHRRSEKLNWEGRVPEVLLVDTTGELAAWQTLASVVVIGKSWLGWGGQNPAEAAYAAKVIVMGPHMENFKEITQALLEHSAAVQVYHINELTDNLEALLADPQKALEMGARAKKVLEMHRGATEKTLKQILDVNSHGMSDVDNK